MTWGGGGFITFVHRDSPPPHLPEPPEYLPDPEYNNGISHISPLESYWHLGPIFIWRKSLQSQQNFHLVTSSSQLLLLLAGLQDSCLCTLQPSLKLHPHFIYCQCSTGQGEAKMRVFRCQDISSNCQSVSHSVKLEVFYHLNST